MEDGGQRGGRKEQTRRDDSVTRPLHATRPVADLSLDTDLNAAVITIHSHESHSGDAPVGSEVAPVSVAPRDAEGVDVGATLGKGGMATVRAGRQLKLDRPVAVKSLRPRTTDDTNVARLLREARITGRLEHPNIVPVHDIVRGEDGLPRVVLKLIEGDTWQSLLGDDDRIRAEYAADDVLEWHLEVFSSVARALSFAHSRRVIHRDVKPANVMVGPFGEVYLLDWGIALDLEVDDPVAGKLSGTLSYLAPEQLGLFGGRIGPWTDTFLLAATLFRVLGGRAPFAGATTADRLEATEETFVSPALSDEVPAELRAIVARAMVPDPRARTQTPEELRLAVAGFLQHRSALRFAERGDRERADAEALADPVAGARAQLAAQIAYRAALDEWPECREARAGLQALARLRVEQALRDGDAEAAALALLDLDDAPPSLRARVTALAAETEAQTAQLEQLVTDADRAVGHGKRGLFGGGAAALWVAFWLWVAITPPATVWPLVGFMVGFGAVGLGAARALAPQLFQTRINRTSMAVVASALLLALVWCVGAAAMGLTVQQVVIGLLFASAFFAAGMATLMDPWGSVSAVGFAVAFLVACYEPRWTPHAMVAGNGIMLLNQLVLNWARARRGFQRLPRPGRRRRRAEAREGASELSRRGGDRG